MTISSRSFIVPYVAMLDRPPTNLMPNPAEVDAVLHVPVDSLLAPDVFHSEIWPWPTGGDHTIVARRDPRHDRCVDHA